MAASSARVRRSTAERGYGGSHNAIRRRLGEAVLAGGVRCARCRELIVPGEEWHLGHTDDRSGYSGPEHARCNLRAGGVVGAAVTNRRRWVQPAAEPVAQPEREGVPVSDERWAVSWLKRFRRVPADAVWPRYMTVPHARAAGSLGPKFVRWAEKREGRPLRWWQKLVATRLLEVDAAGELVWDTLLLTMARQLGKSWLLRELLLWRVHQADQFGEPQDVLHTGKDLQVCKEVLRPALYWALDQPGYKVGRAAGEMFIERLEDHSRWLLRSRGAVYGYSVSVGAVDEAWKVRPEVVDEGLAPTMVERAQSQLWLISTAHREATALMLSRRKAALANLEVDDGVLMIEWSTPKACELDDVAGWRMASPHWTPQRERLIGKQLEAVYAGEAELVEDEADPVEAFRAQWLNQWPDRSVPTGLGEPLLPAGLWEALEEPIAAHDLPLHVTVEDSWGRGAAVAAAAMLPDGRVEVDGWTFPDWDSAIEFVESLIASRKVKQIGVGASLLVKAPPGMWPPPRPVGAAETRAGLPLLRDLSAGCMIIHENTPDLDEAMLAAMVKERAVGLALEPVNDTTHLIKALVWAVHAAAKPARVPAVY